MVPLVHRVCVMWWHVIDEMLATRDTQDMSLAWVKREWGGASHMSCTRRVGVSQYCFLWETSMRGVGEQGGGHTMSSNSFHALLVSLCASLGLPLPLLLLLWDSFVLVVMVNFGCVG
jgi:hypothetical protein